MTPTPAGRGARIAATAAVLVVTWILWSWLFKPLVLFFGLVSVAIVMTLLVRMGYFRSDLYALRVNGRFLLYWMWLLREIFRSSVDVARIVLSPSLPISPRTISVEVGSDDPVRQTILANSITLTPGTLALDVDGDRIEVHALTIEGAAALASGEMRRRVEEL